MALQMLKETKGTISGMHRLPSPSPGSSSRRAASRSTSGIAFKSKLLAALDAELDALQAESIVVALSKSTKASAQAKSSKLVSKPLKPSTSSSALQVHSFFPKDQPISGISKKPRSKGKAQSGKTKTAATSSNTFTLTTMNETSGPSWPSPTTTAKPLFCYKDYVPMPEVVYTCNEDEANDFVLSLKGPIGFDMEWPVTFRPGSECRTALIQLADSRMILLIQLTGMSRFPQKVKELIESPNVIKMGPNIRNDGTKLFRDYGILANNLVELAGVARQADPTFGGTYRRSIVSLAIMTDRYLNKSIDKGSVRTSNWDKVPLSEAQQTYAANDAYCALMIYACLMNMAKDNNINFIPEPYTSNLKEGYAAGRLSSPNARHTTSTTVTTLSSSIPNFNNTPVPNPRFVVNNQVVTRWRSRTQVQPGDKAKFQHVRAYNLWHTEQASLDRIRATLRSPDNPLAESTVISYVVQAIQADPALPFDMIRLRDFVQLEAGSWARHRDWLIEMDALLAAA